MAPNLVSETPEDFKPDWNCSELHEKLISPGTKEEKITCYAQWAETYDHDVTSFDYCAFNTVSNVVVTLVQEHLRLHEDSPVQVFDAGCGTGLTAEALKREAAKAGVDVQIDGVDYSQGMLDLAEPKGVYENLALADLNEKLQLGGKRYDVCVSTGVFLEGHCGPPALPNVLACLRKGGYAVISIRNESFKADEIDYLKAIADSGCQLIENKVMAYMGPVVANYVTILRISDAA